jgi:sulfonate transport system ATP-binding protein
MSAAAGVPVAAVTGLTRAFNGRRVLDGVELELAAGEIVALIGRSGSGKSTLLRALAGLDRSVGGEIAVSGTVAVAFQDARLLPWRRVLDNVQIGLRTAAGVDHDAAARQALDEVGLSDHLEAWPLTLSGGEAQRVSVARALVREPDLLLLDEPFGALDALTRVSMHELLLELWRRHRPAILMVTHDVDEALALADRVLVLRAGQITRAEPILAGRPRDWSDPELVPQRRRLLAELGV